MSTNDEIRKATEAVIPTLFKWHAQSVGDHRAHEDAITENHIDDFVADLLTALAPYLAPHPAQQGEDSKRLEWLLEYITAKGTNGMAELEWSLYDEEGKSLNSEKSVTEDDVEEIRFDRATIDRGIARSHSKQEGGA